MSEYAPKHMAATQTTPNPYEQLQDVMAPMVAERRQSVAADKTAEEIADSYILAKAAGQEANHEAHTDAQPYLEDMRQPLAEKNLAITSHQIALNQEKIASLQKRLDSGALTTKLENKLRQELADLEKDVAGWQSKLAEQTATYKTKQKEEADRLHTIVRTAADHKIGMNAHLDDVYDFWGFKDDQPAPAAKANGHGGDQNGPAVIANEAEPAEQPKEDPSEIVDSPAQGGEDHEDTAQPEHLEGFHFDIGRAEAASSHHGEGNSQDRIISNPKHGLFAVIDGMGGHEGGAVAADLIQRSISEYFETLEDTVNSENVIDHLQLAVQFAEKAIRTAEHANPELEGMGAVATFVKAFIDTDGQPKFGYIHAGDTRLYTLDDNDQLTQLTHDEVVDREGRHHVVTNAIDGHDAFDLNQSGVEDFPEGMRLILFTDGIAGDEGTDVLKPHEIEGAVMVSSPRTAASNLLEISRKEDDKAILVVDSDGGRAHLYDQDEDQDATPPLPIPAVTGQEDQSNDFLADEVFEGDPHDLVGAEWLDQFGYLNRVVGVNRDGQLSVQRRDGPQINDRRGRRNGDRLHMTYRAGVQEAYRDLLDFDVYGNRGTRAHAYMYQKGAPIPGVPTPVVPEAEAPAPETASRQRAERLRRMGGRVVQAARDGQERARSRGWTIRRTPDEQGESLTAAERTRRLRRRLGAVASQPLVNRRNRRLQQEAEDSEDEDESTPVHA